MKKLYSSKFLRQISTFRQQPILKPKVSQTRGGTCAQILINQHVFQSSTMKQFTNQLYELERDDLVTAVLIQVNQDIQEHGGLYGFDYRNFNQDYLKDLFVFTYMLGQIETPLISLVNNNWKGYSNIIPLVTAFPSFTQYGHCQFSDYQCGLPPLFMAYQLAQLDGNLGLYLALTGEKLHSVDKALLYYKKIHYTGETYKIENHYEN